jgi:uncharacterized membrane protein YhhN
LAKVLFVAGLICFIVTFIAELAFIMLGLTAASQGTTASPGLSPGLVVSGCIGLGVLCWMIAAAILLIDYFRNRA